MHDIGWILIWLGLTLAVWPYLQRLLLPKFKSGIQWERIIWGYRPGVLRWFLAGICLLAGIGFNLLLGNSLFGSEAESQWHVLGMKALYGLVPVAIIVAIWLGRRTPTVQQETAYVERMSRRKRLLYVVVPIAALLTGMAFYRFVWSVVIATP